MPVWTVVQGDCPRMSKSVADQTRALQLGKGALWWIDCSPKITSRSLDEFSLAQAADVNSADYEWIYPLWRARKSEQVEMLVKLLEKGIKSVACPKIGLHPQGKVFEEER